MRARVVYESVCMSESKRKLRKGSKRKRLGLGLKFSPKLYYLRLWDYNQNDAENQHYKPYWNRCFDEL
jgi:hypothetical protein